MGPACQPGPLVSETETGETACDGVAAAMLADGEDSSDTEGTYMIYVTSHAEWCYWQDLKLTGDSSSPAKAARWSSGARYRRR